MVRSDRRSVSFPMWRKKVDRTLLNDQGCTVLPSWVVDNFGIKGKYGVGKNKEENMVLIHFKNEVFSGGAITVQTKSRATPFYRLWLPLELVEELRKSFQMTYIRGLEEELQKKDNTGTEINWDSENEIPFWEFLDIEYDYEYEQIYLTAHWTQKPTFPKFYEQVIKSQLTKRIEKEVLQGKELVITKGDWKERSLLQSQIRAKNVIYWLADVVNKELYVGMAESLTDRVTNNRPEIPNWTHYRFDVLPREFDEKIRLEIEKMTIRSIASILTNNPTGKKSIPSLEISDYKLKNKQIER